MFFVAKKNTKKKPHNFLHFPASHITITGPSRHHGGILSTYFGLAGFKIFVGLRGVFYMYPPEKPERKAKWMREMAVSKYFLSKDLQDGRHQVSRSFIY